MGRDGTFPGKEELKEYTAESYSSVDGTIQWFEFYCVTSYDKLDKTYKDKSITGAGIGAFVNKLKRARTNYRQKEIK